MGGRSVHRKPYMIFSNFSSTQMPQIRTFCEKKLKSSNRFNLSASWEFVKYFHGKKGKALDLSLLLEVLLLLQELPKIHNEMLPKEL